jgi:aminoglycoside/choline kinase family phosphotransferase
MAPFDQAAPVAGFLRAAGWQTAQTTALAGDASTRHYSRLHGGRGTAILMQAGPEGRVGTEAFVAMANWLRHNGLSAPEVLAARPEQGLLLLEDLGDDLLLRLVRGQPSLATQLYSAAVDVLRAIGDCAAPPGLIRFDGPKLGELITLLPDWYLPGIDAPPVDTAPLHDAMSAAYQRLAGSDVMVVALRDYHAENLIWLSDRSGPARVGLLDFQDAVLAHPAYDLVSLLQDARNDVPPEVEHAMIARFLGNRAEGDRFRAIYALLGAQRSLRIFGIFVRLCLHFGKPAYLAHIPRLWRYITRDLAHPDLRELRDITLAAVPEPTPERIERIRARCGTFPAP